MAAPGAPRIADLVEVSPAETVVRLDGTPGRLVELVLTGDVTRSLGAALEAASGAAGGAYLVVGHFGSGKSHFLAALGELLQDPERARRQAGWPERLRELGAAARPSLAVAVPLVEHRARAALEDVVWEHTWRALGRTAPAAGSDRSRAWDQALEAARDGGRAGLALLVDELSEFLRAKQGPELTEDLRFLQFLGEWARRRPVLVLGALQESIEEVANVSQRELARIRDRYPVTLGLSMRHVEDLVRGRLVPLRPGAEAWIERAYRELKEAFPRWAVSLDRFRRCYPIHPETLALLDGLRFLFSQQRGAVDFICRQLRGDGAAGLPAWQERPYAEVVTPERIYDHFQARLHERVETSRLAGAVVPYYERALPSLFESERDRRLAGRAVKLLTLLAASPVERRRSGRELAEMLLERVSALDPEVNYEYLERHVLDALAGHGAYVVARPAEDGPRYGVELEADASLVARERVAQVRADLQPGDRRVVQALAELASSPALPLHWLKRSGRTRREMVWQNTLRSLLVEMVRLPDIGGAELEAMVAAMESTGAEAALLVAEIEFEPLNALRELAEEVVHTARGIGVWVPAPPSPEDAEFAIDLFCRRQVLAAAGAGGEPDERLAEHLGRSAEADAARAREVLGRCYFGGVLVTDAGVRSVDLPSLSGLPFDRLLRALAAPLLADLHPRHQEVQPHAELVGERVLRQLIAGPLASPRTSVASAERQQLRLQIEGYLVPLGVVRKRGDAYLVAPDPARSPAVAELLRLTAGPAGASAGEVARALAAGPVGLTEAETLLLLNAAAQSGMLEASRRGRRVEAPFFSLSEVDRLSPGELVEPGLLGRLPELAPVVGPGPYEPWNARVQQSCWEHARAWLEGRREEVAQVGAALGTLAGLPAATEVDPEPVPADLALVGRLLEDCDVGAAPREGLERLLGAVEDPAALLAAAHRLAAVARFVRSDQRDLVAALDYLRHPDLTIPAEDDYRRLRELREEALGLAARILPLAAEDRAQEFFSAYQQFRRAFSGAYEEEHARYYAAVGGQTAAAVTGSPEYRALAALSEVAAASVPDDRVRVDRALEGLLLPPCPRRVESELGWRPACPCGFRLGRRPPPVEVPALLGVAASGVAQHLTEMGRPESRARLEQAAEDLASLGRQEAAEDLRRFLGLVSEPASAEPAAAAHLLAGPLRETLRSVLGGDRVVLRRDLARLREELVGRRYPRRRLRELFEDWVAGGEEVPEGAFIEVLEGDRAGAAPAPAARRPDPSPTVAFLRERFPALAAALPSERPADAFWLAAWWEGRPHPPAWLPASLREAEELGTAARAAVADPAARAELADLDARVGPRTLTGDQVAAALDLGRKEGLAVADDLFGERLLGYPVRLGVAELLGRLGSDPQLASRLPAGGLARLRAGHALLEPHELEALERLLEAALHLVELERRLPAPAAALVEEVYPRWHAPVTDLISRAEVALAGGSVVDPTALGLFAKAARRRLGEAEAAFQEAASAGFPGCLRPWEVGEQVIGPLLRRTRRVAVLLVDAMRADLWLRLRGPFREALPGRRLVERWMVVPEPTRTAEALAALYLGRPVPAGSAPEVVAPFANLGYETAVLGAADRDSEWQRLRDLWAHGPALSMAVARGVDERLHRTPVELAALLDESAAGLTRRLLPSLRALPPSVPLVVLADHGFRESPSWGHGGEGRYTHGGLSLEESVVPVAVLEPSLEGP
jgi:hypothetical protein